MGMFSGLYGAQPFRSPAPAHRVVFRVRVSSASAAGAAVWHIDHAGTGCLGTSHLIKSEVRAGARATEYVCSDIWAILLCELAVEEAGQNRELKELKVTYFA